MKPNYIGHETAWHLPSRYLTDDRARGGVVSDQHIEPAPCRKQWQPDQSRTWLPKKAHSATVLTRRPLLDELGVPGVQDGVESFIPGERNPWSSVMCWVAPPERDQDATLLNDLPAPVGSESSFEDEEEERSPLAEFNKRSKRWHRYARHQSNRADTIMRGVDMGANGAPTPMSEVVERTDQHAVAQLIAYLQTTLSSDDEGEYRISAGQLGSNLAGVQDVVGEVGDYLSTSSEEEKQDYPQLSAALGLAQERRELNVKKRRTAEKKNWKFLKSVVGSVGATTKRRKQPVISLETPKDRERKAAVKKRKVKDHKLRDDYDIDSDSPDNNEGIVSTDDPRSDSPLSVVSSKSHSVARSNASGAVPYRRTKIAGFASTPAPLSPRSNDGDTPPGTAQQVVAVFKVSDDVEVRVVREEGSDLVFILEAMNHSDDKRTITINMDILGDTFDIMDVFVPVSNSPIVVITVEGRATLTILRMKLRGHDICMPDDILRSMGAAIKQGGNTPPTRAPVPPKKSDTSHPISNDGDQPDEEGDVSSNKRPNGIHPAMLPTTRRGTKGGDAEAGDSESPKGGKGPSRGKQGPSTSPRTGRGKAPSTRESSTGKSPKKGAPSTTRTKNTVSQPLKNRGKSSNVKTHLTQPTSEEKQNNKQPKGPTSTVLGVRRTNDNFSDRGPSPLDNSNDTLPPHSRSRSPMDHFQPPPLPWRQGFQSQSDFGPPPTGSDALDFPENDGGNPMLGGTQHGVSEVDPLSTTPSRNLSNLDGFGALASGGGELNSGVRLEVLPHSPDTKPDDAKSSPGVTTNMLMKRTNGNGNGGDGTTLDGHRTREGDMPGSGIEPTAPLHNAGGSGGGEVSSHPDGHALIPSKYPTGGAASGISSHTHGGGFQPHSRRPVPGEQGQSGPSNGTNNSSKRGVGGSSSNNTNIPGNGAASNSFGFGEFGNMDSERRRQELELGGAYYKPKQPSRHPGANVVTPASKGTHYNLHHPDHRVHPNSRQHMGSTHSGRSQKVSPRGQGDGRNNALGQSQSQQVSSKEVAANQMKHIILRSNVSTIPRVQTTPLEQTRPQSSVEKYLRSGTNTPRPQRKNMLLSALLEIAEDNEDTGAEDGADNADLIEQIVDYMIGAPDSGEAIQALLAATAGSNAESVAKAVAHFLATNDEDGHIMQMIRKKDPGLYLEVAGDIASFIGGGPLSAKKPHHADTSHTQRRSIRFPAAHTGATGPYTSKGLSFKAFKGMMNTHAASSPSPRRGPQTAQTLLLENQRLEAVVDSFMAAIKSRVMHPHPMSVAFSKMVVAIGTRLRHLQRVNLEKLICIMHRKMGDKGWFPPYSDDAVVDGAPANGGRPLGKSTYTFQELVRPGRLVGWTFAEDPNNAPLEEAEVVTLEDLETWIESHRGPHLCPIPPPSNPDLAPRKSLSVRDRRRALSCSFV